MNPFALEIGGLYQKHHESFNVCNGIGARLADLDSEMDAMLDDLPGTFGVSFPDTLTAVPIAVSKGLFLEVGVFAEPKEAKAPDPRPKAVEALVGDVTPPGVGGKEPLPCDAASAFWRFAKEPLRLEDS